MMDLVKHAFACDLTRIASVQLSRGFSGIVHSWVDATQGYHTISHLDGDNTIASREMAPGVNGRSAEWPRPTSSDPRHGQRSMGGS
jgi:hypothetical protein